MGFQIFKGKNNEINSNNKIYLTSASKLSLQRIIIILKVY